MIVRDVTVTHDDGVSGALKAELDAYIQTATRSLIDNTAGSVASR